VLASFSEADELVQGLVRDAADEAERVIEQITSDPISPEGDAEDITAE
jgi:hypothetical protein